MLLGGGRGRDGRTWSPPLNLTTCVRFGTLTEGFSRASDLTSRLKKFHCGAEALLGVRGQISPSPKETSSRFQGPAGCHFGISLPCSARKLSI